MYEWEKNELAFPICTGPLCTILMNLPHIPSQEAGRTALYLTSTLTANTYWDLFCWGYAGRVPVTVSEGED